MLYPVFLYELLSQKIRIGPGPASARRDTVDLAASEE